jgi:hypothetical protein
MTLIGRVMTALGGFRIQGFAGSYPRCHAVPTAAVAECTCPEFCERDHDNE